MTSEIWRNRDPNMQFSIKYTISDYLAAVRFKFKKATIVISETHNYKGSLLLFRLLYPFILGGILVFAFFKKLSKEYNFILTESRFTRTSGDTEESVLWSRFSSYEVTEDFILLQLDKNKGNADGQVLFPRRCFDESSWQQLMNTFEKNDIHAGEIDLNMKF